MSEEAKLNPDEITTDELEEQLASAGEPSESPSGLQVPKKFVGKSFDEVVESYSNVEKHAGKLASELDQERKAREELESRLKELETRSSSMTAQPQYTPQQAPSEPQVDPLAELDNYWDDDPKQAIKIALEKERQRQQAEEQRRVAQQYAASAAEYYQKQRAENPDYVRREPAMQQLLTKYQHIFNPSTLNSKEVLEFLDLASRGTDIDYYSKQAVEKAKEQKQEVVEKKRAAFSESPVSDGEERIDVDKIPLDQLEAMLTRHDD